MGTAAGPQNNQDPKDPPIKTSFAIQDWVVDVTAVRELAEYCGVEPIIFDGAAHDLMLVRFSSCQSQSQSQGLNLLVKVVSKQLQTARDHVGFRDLATPG